MREARLSSNDHFILLPGVRSSTRKCKGIRIQAFRRQRFADVSYGSDCSRACTWAPASVALKTSLRQAQIISTFVSVQQCLASTEGGKGFCKTGQACSAGGGEVREGPGGRSEGTQREDR